MASEYRVVSNFGKDEHGGPFYSKGKAYARAREVAERDKAAVHVQVRERGVSWSQWITVKIEGYVR